MDQSPLKGRRAASTPFFERWGAWIGCLLLVVGTLTVYWPVRHFGFISFDDPSYVAENVHVKSGLNWENFKWAWQASVASALANWHPLTLISHMLDCQLFGVNPGPHHVVNALFHTANACLLFALLLRTTKRREASFVVAALFAWHPMHVESVAWIAERKDVLSTFLGLLAVHAYASYAAPSKIKKQRSKLFYALSLFCYALSLLAKPMLVTLPFLLLLLDYWPLRRIQWKGEREESDPPPTAWSRLLWEKSPFLLLAVIFCWVALWAQKTGGAVVSTGSLPLESRLAHAAWSYWRYLAKLAWPTNLAIFYPYEGQTSLTWMSWAPAAGLLAVCAIVAFAGRKRYLAAGWFWFCGMLVPVIGIVQVGTQAMADRYTYLSAVGIFMIAANGMDDIAARVRFGRAGLVFIASLSLAACLAVTSRQLRHWHDNVALYSHAIGVTKNNELACNNLGTALKEQGKFEESVVWFKEALRIDPNYADAHCNLAVIYHRFKQGPKAVQEFQAALRSNPSDSKVHYFLALQLRELGDSAHAVEHLRLALRAQPERAEILYQLAVTLMARGEVPEAQQRFREALRLSPDQGEVINSLAWSLATYSDARYRNGKEAVELAERGAELSHANNPAVLDTLGAALAETGHFPEAIQTAEKASQLAQQFHAEPLVREIDKHLTFYREQKPFRDTPATSMVPPGK